MSYGTRKAIAGTRDWQRRTDEAVNRTVADFNAAITRADIVAILERDKRFNWFLRTKAQDDRMKAAYWDAVNRAKAEGKS